MTTEPDESNFNKYQRLNAEADRLQLDHSARRSSNNGRATTLIGAASIAATLAAGSPGYWTFIAIAAFLAGAILGILALWPRGGKGMTVDGLFDRLFTTSREDIELQLLQAKLQVQLQDETSLNRLAWPVRLGFACVALGVFFIVFHVAGVSIDTHLPETP